MVFFKYLDKLVNFRYKIVIAGNHEISMDNGCVTQKKKEIYLKKYPCSVRDFSYSSQENRFC